MDRHLNPRDTPDCMPARAAQVHCALRACWIASLSFYRNLSTYTSVCVSETTAASPQARYFGAIKFMGYSAVIAILQQIEASLAGTHFTCELVLLRDRVKSERIRLLLSDFVHLPGRPRCFRRKTSRCHGCGSLPAQQATFTRNLAGGLKTLGPYNGKNE